MSTSVISFIPADPTLLVSDDDAKAVEQYLTEAYSGSAEIQMNRSHTRPFFIDAGQNHREIQCPECKNEIAVELWQGLMNQCWIESDRGFDLTAATLKCCNRNFSPHQLAYVPMQGFAMASFEVTNPIDFDHQAATVRIEELLNTQMRLVEARY